MSAMNRTAYVNGPAVVVLGSQYFYVDEKSAIKVDDIVDTWQIGVSGYGKVDDRKKASYVKISFKPSGMVSAGIITSLLPYLSYTPGQSMAGSSDTTVVIWPFSGVGKRSIAGAFISKMPTFTGAPTATAWGAVEITAIGKNSTAVTDSSKYDQLAAAAMADASMSVSAHMTVPYSISIGALSAPWNDVKTDEKGFTLSFNMSHKMIYVPGDGYIDAKLESVTGTLEFTPMNCSEANALALFTLFAAADGASVAGLGADITLTGGTGNPVVVGKSATLMELPSQFDASNPRTEKLKFNLQRAGGTGALATVGIAA